MSDYTIQDFWRARIPASQVGAANPIAGWSVERDGFPTFKEAPLTKSTEPSSASDPQNSPIILISAPGAVGKSTLARQLAFATNAVYVDLAKADPVGGNAISGGLVRSGLYSSWQSQTTTLIIDGLDEARLRVTQEAFKAFLEDVAQLSRDRRLPTVLFGRTGAIQDAWLLLADCGVDAPVLEIGYYNEADSVDFAMARVRAMRPNSSHVAVEREAVQLLLRRLRDETVADGDRFAGYAPVLQAIAERVGREDNSAALVAKIMGGAQPITLQVVVSSILERERGKIDGLKFETDGLTGKLYLPDEQLDRLVARIYSLEPPAMPHMKAADVNTYSTALETWVAEHPFLNGPYQASSAVFDAIISVRALRNPISAETAALRELRRGAAANPFLSEFYLPGTITTQPVFLPPEHIGIIYASLRARLSLGDTASLLVEAPEEAKDEQALTAQVEITLARRGSERPRILSFNTEQTGVLRLGSYVEDVDLMVPLSHVEIGPGPEAVFFAPINIQCERLTIAASRMIVECAPGSSNAAVFLEADTSNGSQVTSVPVLRGHASLAVVWPSARLHPWTSFATAPSVDADPRVEEGLRRFRRFVTAFRSHSKGNLARYVEKIDHERMTKGAGHAVLNRMKSEGILTQAGAMYFLDPSRLGELTGATYADCMSRRFSAKAIAFVRGALETGG